MREKMQVDQLLIGIGAVVSRQRKIRHLSQEQFAHKCNLHRTCLSDIENGKRNVTMRVLEVISNGLSLSLYKLLEMAEQADLH